MTTWRQKAITWRPKLPSEKWENTGGNSGKRDKKWGKTGAKICTTAVFAQKTAGTGHRPEYPEGKS